MKLGFIGTGEITKAVVIGVLGSKIKFQKIYLSKRNSKISAFLTKKNKKIQIEKSTHAEIVLIVFGFAFNQSINLFARKA